ncbi:hypothetical protein ACPZ19_04695 [Amycolatopsis lurida]
MADFRSGRELISAGDFHQLVRYLAEREHMERPYAARAIDQLLAFLVALGNSGLLLIPDEDVDTAWRALVVHTELYREFCDKYNGRYIDYHPVPGSQKTATLRKWSTRWDSTAKKYVKLDESYDHSFIAVHEIQQSGFYADLDLWLPGRKPEHYEEAAHQGFEIIEQDRSENC